MERWAEARVAAGVMLALFVGIAAVLSLREVRFLAGVEPRQRRLFIFHDVIVQLAIIGVLLPCAVFPYPTKRILIGVMASFTLLWISALWAVVSRSMYTYRLMLGVREERRELDELLRRAGMSSAGEPSAPRGGEADG
jgi:hypothetical protein